MVYAQPVALAVVLDVPALALDLVRLVVLALVEADVNMGAEVVAVILVMKIIAKVIVVLDVQTIALVAVQVNVKEHAQMIAEKDVALAVVQMDALHVQAVAKGHAVEQIAPGIVG